MTSAQTINVAGTPMTLSQFQALAAQRGWADPTAFTPDLVRSESTERDWGTETQYSLADPERWAKNNDNTRITRTGGDYPAGYEGGEDPSARTPTGWAIEAGEVPGAPRYTRVYYQYDDAGNLQGVNTESDTRWYEDAAPLLSVLAGPLAGAIAPGLNAAIGSATGLGSFGSNVLGRALIGGGLSALTGGDFIRGAFTGAVGAGITPAIASWAEGIGLPEGLANTAASSLVRGATTALSGGSFTAGLAGGALEGLYGQVASETGVPVAAIRTLGQLLGVNSAVAGAAGGGARPQQGPQGTGQAPAGAQAAVGGQRAAGLGGLGSTSPLQNLALYKAVDAKAKQMYGDGDSERTAQVSPARSRKDVYTGNYYGAAAE